MKKILVIAAICGMLVACGGDKSSAGDAAVNKVEKIYKALEADDYDKAVEYAEDFNEWGENLSKSKQKEADKALEKWAEKNPEKSETVLNFLYSME